jgi:hypothetical protein
MAHRRQLWSWLLLALVFAIGPGLGVLGTTVAERATDQQFHEMAPIAVELARKQYDELAKSVLADSGAPNSTPDNANSPNSVGGIDLPEFGSIDKFCELSKQVNNESEFCKDYEHIKIARITSIVGLALTPLVPILLIWSLAAGRKRNSTVHAVAGRGILWVANKINGLKSGALAITFGFVASALGL